MLIDFTFRKYRELLLCLRKQGYIFITYEQYCEKKSTLAQTDRWVILRHDVDKSPQQSLVMAELERELDITSTYYFRSVSQSYDPKVISSIVALGHEIGYHYEDLSLAKGNLEKAFKHFQDELANLRMYYPVRTICMHGNPMSKYNEHDLWKQYDYRALGIIGESYLDTDFADVFYLTDTGRRWDGYKVSLRDRIPMYQEDWVSRGLVYKSTDDIMKASANSLPDHIMLTVHPQRWTDNRRQWVKEIMCQRVKNIFKRLIFKIKGH